MDNLQTLLDQTHAYLQESVAPQATEMDSDPEVLYTALRGLGGRALLALRVPKAWGGTEASAETFWTFQEMVARYSGALAFVQTQHQSAAAMLAQSDNELLKQEYLPPMNQGKTLVGIAFSQLRRQGDPLVKALPVAGGYQLDGKLPWVTGFRFFQSLLVAAVLPDHRSVFGIVPFVATHQVTGGEIAFSEPLPLAAMTSTNTVTANLSQWFLPEFRVVTVKPAGWIHENDRRNVLAATFLALGCATAGLDILEATSQEKPWRFIADALGALSRERESCRTAIVQAQQDHQIPFATRLHLRAWAIDLAVRSSQAAIAVSSGAANYKHHAAQRVYREALVFTVSGQTPEIMEATLARLVGRC